MATGTFYLRPSADTSVEHTLYPTSSTAAYLLINEKTADDDSTYLQFSHSGSSGSSSSATSQFALSGDIPIGKIKVTSIKLIHTSLTSNTSQCQAKVTFSIGVNNTTCSVSSSVRGTFYSMYVVDVADTTFISAVNSNSTFPDLTLTVTTTGSTFSGSVSKTTDIKTTQVYLEITYEEVTDIGVHKKVNGAWVAAIQAYRKVDGAWTEIAADECKQILQSSLCRRGE